MIKSTLTSRKLIAAVVAMAASCTLSCWQKALADTTFDINGVVTDPQGGGGAGYSSSPTDTASDVRLSDSYKTGESPDRSMEKELSPDYTSDQRSSRNNIPLAGAPVTTTSLGPKNGNFGVNQLDKVYGGGLNKLPQTRLDSFVAQAGGQAEMIYGDEGVFDIPPLFFFTGMSRINSGIHSGGLTTGHEDGSLPEAWGFPN